MTRREREELGDLLHAAFPIRCPPGGNCYQVAGFIARCQQPGLRLANHSPGHLQKVLNLVRQLPPFLKKRCCTVRSIRKPATACTIIAAAQRITQYP